MANQSYTPVALRAYMAGRQLAHLMSVDSASAVVPPEHAAQAAAYQQGIIDEQADAPLPTETPSGSAPPLESTKGAAQKSPAAPAPSKQVAAPPPVGKASSAEAEARWRRNREQKDFLSRLKLEPVEAIRAVAEAQILRVEATFQKDAPYYSRTIQLDYAGIKDRLANARVNLDAGDKLRDKADEASKTERRNSYLRAYNVAFGEADSLDRLIGGESFAILTMGQVVIPAAAAAATAVAAAGKDALQAGKDALQAGAGLVGAVGNTARNVGYLVGAGAALALIVFASQRGKRR